MDIETAYQRPRQFARIIGVAESTLAKLRMRGDGPPFVKVGRAVKYPVREGLEWMAARTRRSTSELPLNETRSRKKRRASPSAAGVRTE
jgi:predicted DNA-binding transcriptional regulator AlpA